MSHQPAARTTFYDAALGRHIDRIRQLVILGAGFDTGLSTPCRACSMLRG